MSKQCYAFLFIKQDLVVFISSFNKIAQHLTQCAVQQRYQRPVGLFIPRATHVVIYCLQYQGNYHFVCVKHIPGGFINYDLFRPT